MAKSRNIDSLRITVTDIDAICQDACAHIRAISDLVSIALRTDDGTTPRLSTIQDAVRLINHLASDLTNTINSEAESVGCNWRSENAEMPGGSSHV